MKKLGILALCAVLFTSCSVNTSGNVDIDATDIKYVKDSRTGLCYGVVASRRTFSFSTTGLGVTCVPCADVEKLLD